MIFQFLMVNYGEAGLPVALLHFVSFDLSILPYSYDRFHEVMCEENMKRFFSSKIFHGYNVNIRVFNSLENMRRFAHLRWRSFATSLIIHISLGSRNGIVSLNYLKFEMTAPTTKCFLRYVLDVNVEWPEDVLTHLAEDPTNRPIFEVRIMQGINYRLGLAICIDIL
ncbi:hypothetical protein CRYUN_Cryun26dG0134500 [Craigia yunnanensis]